MDVAVSTSDLRAEGSLMENTSAEMFLVASQANAGKLVGQKSEESRGICPWGAEHAGRLLMNDTGTLYSSVISETSFQCWLQGHLGLV